MTRRMIVTVSVGIIAAVLTACAQWVGIEDLQEVCGEWIVADGLPVGDYCSGTLLSTFPIEAEGGVKFGELSIYYDDSTAKNCAIAQATGSVEGNATEIKVHLSRCSETSGSSTCTREQAESDPSLETPGSYSSYAGPIYMDAKGQCIYSSASILYNGQCAQGSTGGAVFCD